MKASVYIRRAKALEKRLHNLQSDIYYLSHDLEDEAERNNNEAVKGILLKCEELASESGFELDVSHIKMKEVYETIQNAFARKI